MKMRSRRAAFGLSLLMALALAGFMASAAVAGGAHCASKASTASSGDQCAAHKASMASAGMSDEACKELCMHFSVAGMSCGGCEPRVEKALASVKGVKSVTADYKTGQAVVILSDPGTKSKSLVKAAKKAGFKAQLIKA